MNFCNYEEEDDDGVVGFLFLHQLNQNRLAITTATHRWEKKQQRNTREREAETTQARTGKKTEGYALRDRTGQLETSHFPCGPLAAHHGPSRALFPFCCFFFHVFTSLIIRQVTWLLPYMVSSKYTSVRLFFQAAPVLYRFSGRIYKSISPPVPISWKKPPSLLGSDPAKNK